MDTGTVRRRPHLDGLRGLAIALVLVAHVAGLNGAGLVGVLLFFVLSGYLITGLLLREHRQTGRVDLRQFYVRRALRLLPALLFFLTLFVVTVSIADLVPPGEAWRGVGLGLTYTTNFALGLQWGYVPELAHLWTLAVEEQFYLAWPLLLLWLLRRPGGVSVSRVGLLIIAGACLRVLSVAFTTVYPVYVYAMPTTWIDCLLVGALLALVLERGADVRPSERSGWLISALPVLSLAVLVAFGLDPGTYESTATYVTGIPLMAVAGGALIWALEVVRASAWRRVFGHPVARWLGTLSYGLYLYNSACILIVAQVMGEGLAARVVGLGAAVVLAVFSYAAVERPALALKARVGGPRPPRATGGEHGAHDPAQADDRTGRSGDGVTGVHWPE
jgi:peptidoglycan/LPS O-acetylase OafA/YrhL